MNISEEGDVVLILTKWEANDIRKILNKMRTQPTVSKSQFSLREKATGRKLVDLLTERLIEI